MVKFVVDCPIQFNKMPTILWWSICKQLKKKCKCFLLLSGRQYNTSWVWSTEPDAPNGRLVRSTAIWRHVGFIHGSTWSSLTGQWKIGWLSWWLLSDIHVDSMTSLYGMACQLDNKSTCPLNPTCQLVNTSTCPHGMPCQLVYVGMPIMLDWSKWDDMWTHKVDPWRRTVCMDGQCEVINIILKGVGHQMKQITTWQIKSTLMNLK